MSGSTASKFVFDPRHATDRLRGVVEAVCFWTAVVLPFLYMPTFALGDLVSPTLIAVAVALNMIAILLGHRHDPSHARR